MLFIVLMMFAFNCLTDKYRSEHRKYEGLYKSHQHFDKINKNGKCNGKRGRSPAREFIHVAKNKYQRNQTDNNDMTSYHVCEQTYDEGKGLDKNTDKFNRNQYEFYSQRYAGRIENMTPVMFIGTEKNNNKRDNAQNSSKSNIACN